jgi:uncharacterized membrane protein YuzA (DUF378 family)
MLWLMARHMENRFQTITQLIIPIIGGLGIALMQVIALDVVRYLFTGSWDGFHLG